MNLGCATGHPSFVMSNSFTNQVLAQMALWNEDTRSMSSACTSCPKKLDEEVARLHLDQLGVKLTQADDRRTSRIYRRAGRRPFQARPLPVLNPRAIRTLCQSMPMHFPRFAIRPGTRRLAERRRRSALRCHRCRAAE